MIQVPYISYHAGIVEALKARHDRSNESFASRAVFCIILLHISPDDFQVLMTNQEHNQQPVSSALYTEEYFRTACEGYDEFNTSEGEHLSRRLKAAFELAEVLPGMAVLDVGCGRGEILRHCAQLGANAYGIDYAAVAVSMSREVIQGLNGVTPGNTAVGRADAKKLPFPDAAFDRVLMFDVVEHLHPWELHEAMLEVHRVLKPDGRFIIHTAPNIWYDRYAYPLVRLVRTLLAKAINTPKTRGSFWWMSMNMCMSTNNRLSA